MKKEENILYDEEEIKKGSFFRKLFFIIILIILLTIIYARYVGTTGLFLKDYSISNNKIPSSYSGFKIAHFTDFHYGRTTGLKELETLVKKVNQTKPDLVIFSGDLVDKDYNLKNDEVTKITEQLKEIDSTYGKYYVTGNHDTTCESYYNIFEGAEFMSLDDTYDLIYSKNNEPILVAGLNYQSNGLWINNIIQKYNGTYKILVMHTPDSFDNIKHYNFDLVLAGHSHNGQIRIPIYGAISTPEGSKKYYKPYYKIDNTDMYISSGIGTSIINYRLFNRPSFNLYRLNQKKNWLN